MRDLILQLSKSSIYSTKPLESKKILECINTTITLSINLRVSRLYLFFSVFSCMRNKFIIRFHKGNVIRLV
ncbi:TPA: hypothetical protein MIO94_28925 [Klebsiella pneumoniae]|nr:hypothetical protein [Klebsiella pneumoniae]